MITLTQRHIRVKTTDSDIVQYDILIIIVGPLCMDLMRIELLCLRDHSLITSSSTRYDSHSLPTISTDLDWSISYQVRACMSYQHAPISKQSIFPLITCTVKPALRAYSHQRRTFFPSRFVRTRAFTPKQKNAGRRMNTSAVIGLDVITC